MNAINIAIISLLLLCTHIADASCLKIKVSGQGQAILLMPGFLSDESVWQETAKTLAKSYQVHHLAVAGFGKNRACQQANNIYQQVTEEVENYIASNQLNKPIFVGHSMGGLIAWQLASTPQVKLQAAISIDGLPFIGSIFTRSNATTVADISYQAQLVSNMYRDATPENMRQITQQGIAIQTKNVNKYEAILQMAETSDPTTASSALYSVMTTDLRQQVATMTTPMLLIGAAGGFEKPEQHAASKTLYKAQLSNNPMISLIMNNNGRHFLMWDEPQWLVETMEQFIKERS